MLLDVGVAGLVRDNNLSIRLLGAFSGSEQQAPGSKSVFGLHEHDNSIKSLASISDGHNQQWGNLPTMCHNYLVALAEMNDCVI